MIPLGEAIDIGRPEKAADKKYSQNIKKCFSGADIISPSDLITGIQKNFFVLYGWFIKNTTMETERYFLCENVNKR